MSFVPPDGAFELMRYRIKSKTKVTPPIYCQSQMMTEAGSDVARCTITVGLKHSSSIVTPNKSKSVTVEDVVVTVPFPKAIKTATLTANVGTVAYDESSKVAKWTIGNMSAALGKAPQMSGKVILAGARLEESPPIGMEWKVPVSSISGIAIASLQLTNEQYKPYKGVRTITRSGRFQVRMS